MSTIKRLAVLVLLATGSAFSAASLGILFGGEGDGTAGVSIAGNSDLNGCYTEPDSATMNSYWFDGAQSCSHNMWNSLSGSVSYSCTYQVGEGQLDIQYDDGSTESFSLSAADNGIELDGNYFEYSGAQCS